jgi:hypothetical protein
LAPTFVRQCAPTVPKSSLRSPELLEIVLHNSGARIPAFSDSADTGASRVADGLCQFKAAQERNMPTVSPKQLSRPLPAIRTFACILALLVATADVFAQVTRLKGDEALKHPAVQLAVKAAELLKAGKVDEAMALQTKEALSGWKAMSPADRQEMGAGIVKRSPDPKAFAEAVVKNGELTINGNTGVLGFAIGDNRGAAYFEREGGNWRVTNGPMMFPSDPDPVNETRIEGIDILNHPVGKLALQYLDLIHAGKIDDAKKLATADVQAKWTREPSGEKADTLAYLRKTLPTRAAVTEGLKAGKNLNAVLIIEDDKLATLNLTVSSQKAAGANTTNYTTSSTNIGFAKEVGEWKLAQ